MVRRDSVNVLSTQYCPSERHPVDPRFMGLSDNVNIFSGKYCPSEQHPVEPRFMVLWDNVNIFSAKYCTSQLNLLLITVIFVVRLIVFRDVFSSWSLIVLTVSISLKLLVTMSSWCGLPERRVRRYMTQWFTRPEERQILAWQDPWFSGTVLIPLCSEIRYYIWFMVLRDSRIILKANTVPQN